MLRGGARARGGRTQGLLGVGGEGAEQGAGVPWLCEGAGMPGLWEGGAGRGGREPVVVGPRMGAAASRMGDAAAPGCQRSERNEIRCSAVRR